MSVVLDRLEPGQAARSVPLEVLIAQLEQARLRVAPAFAADRIELVANVSRAILRQGVDPTSPGATHFAYWTRRQALRALSQSSSSRTPDDCIVRPRGLTFHLPPQNVETVFLYSWVISFLCGNANLVRLPTQLTKGIAALLEKFLEALAVQGDDTQFFVQYPAAGETNRALSAVCDARVVWGGDAKVAAFAPLPMRSGGKAIWFGDRRSLGVVNGAALGKLGEGERGDLAERLHNDIFVFDQMACSSPLRLFVVGSEEGCGVAVDSWLAAVADVARRRGTEPATGHVVRKIVQSMALAAAGEVRTVTRHSNALTTVTPFGPRAYAMVGGGFLEVCYVDGLRDVAPTLGENVQTIVHFGVPEIELREFACEIPLLAASRIVPIGQALDFDAIWDGYDLVGELTRLLRIR